MAQIGSPREFQIKLQKNYNLLKEREAKYATAAPRDLLNQIEDYDQAIALTREALEQNTSLDDTMVQTLADTNLLVTNRNSETSSRGGCRP
jgi:hypothetical protein